MRIAVSALGPTLEDRVDERFGRAVYLIVADDESGDLEVVDNGENRNALQGAGIGAAEAVSARGVSAVITGHLGPKAFRALQLSGITGYDGTGMTVGAALDEAKAGRLAVLTEGEAHTGMA